MEIIIKFIQHRKLITVKLVRLLITSIFIFIFYAGLTKEEFLFLDKIQLTTSLRSKCVYNEFYEGEKKEVKKATHH